MYRFSLILSKKNKAIIQPTVRIDQAVSQLVRRKHKLQRTCILRLNITSLECAADNLPIPEGVVEAEYIAISSS